MICVRFAFVLLLLSLASKADALETVFTYQGFLEDGSQPADGDYDLQFRLLNAVDVQVGATIEHADTPVVRGVFTVPLDFGAQFDGTIRRLEIGVRPGDSADPYTVLVPNTPVTTVPYAQVASVAEMADIAADVVANAIDEVDIATDAVTSRTIAANAVGSAEIAANAVTSSEIANYSVGSAELATYAVTESKIAAGAVGSHALEASAVTGSKIATDAVSMAKMLGHFGSGTLSRTEPANSCTDFDVSFGGDVNAGDFPLLAFQAGASLPEDMSITALRVPADNVVEVRICNSANVSRGFTGLQVLLITLR